MNYNLLGGFILKYFLKYRNAIDRRKEEYTIILQFVYWVLYLINKHFGSLKVIGVSLISVISTQRPLAAHGK